MSIDSDKNQELLVRLDERTLSIKNELSQLNFEVEKLKVLIKENREREQLELKNYVTKDEFTPIQRALYAIASTIVMTVIGTLISIVVHK